MAIPLPFDTQGFPVVNAIGGGGGGAVIVADGPFTGGTPRAPTVINDNLVHEITNPAGAGMQVGHHYVVTQIGGADIQVYAAGGAPAVAVARQSPFHLFSGVPWVFSPVAAGQHLFAVKAVDGTADANVFVDSSDAGTGY